MAIGDAQGNIVTTGDVQIVQSDHVDNVPAFPTQQQAKRTSQQSVLPGAVAQRLLGSIISSSSAGLGSATFIQATIPNSTSGRFDFYISDNQGRTIIAFPDTAVFLGLVVKPENQWPTATIGGGNFPVYVNPGNWGLTDNVNSVTTVVCRNNTGADQPVIVACRWRIITQPSSKFADLN